MTLKNKRNNFKLSSHRKRKQKVSVKKITLPNTSILVGGVYTNDEVLKAFYKMYKTAEPGKYIFVYSGNIYEIIIRNGAASPILTQLHDIYYSATPIDSKISEKLTNNQYTIYNLVDEQFIICDGLQFGMNSKCRVLSLSSENKAHSLFSSESTYIPVETLLNESEYLTPMTRNPKHSSPPTHHTPLGMQQTPYKRQPKPAQNNSTPPPVNRSNKPKTLTTSNIGSNNLGPAVNRSKKPTTNVGPGVNRSNKPTTNVGPAVNRSNKPKPRTLTPLKPPRARDYPYVVIKHMGNNKYLAEEILSPTDNKRNIHMFTYKPSTADLQTECFKTRPDFEMFTTNYGDYVCVRGETYEFNPAIPGYILYNMDFKKLNFN